MRRSGRVLKGYEIYIAVVVVILLVAIVPFTASALQHRSVVHAEVRQIHVPGVVVTIDATTIRPYGVALINGKRLTIDCIVAGGGPFVSYSVIDPAGWDSFVVLAGRLPDGRRRWIGIGSEDGALIEMAVRTKAGPGPCGFDLNVNTGIGLALGSMIVV